ncbi:MAG: hypothetical protein ABJF11_19515 [Reichenbachiella sp.]|uniref:hypothetical protein n=1 Tax=Reichenbachiella sp. TaxID=2184521 RepID=UPI0032673276
MIYIKGLSMLIAVILLLTNCNDEQSIDQDLTGSWLFKESSGSLLGYVDADPEHPEHLIFTQDGKVQKLRDGVVYFEYFYQLIPAGAELEVQYRYDEKDDFMPFHKATISLDQLILTPYLGENTHCADCPTEVYSRVISTE